LIRPLPIFCFIISTTYRTHLVHIGSLRNAVADVIHRIIACHLLLLQEEGSVAFTLCKHSDQHIGTCHFFTPGRLHMNYSALNNTLKTCGWFGFFAVLNNQVGQFVVDVVFQLMLKGVDVHIACTHHS